MLLFGVFDDVPIALPHKIRTISSTSFSHSAIVLNSTVQRSMVPHDVSGLGGIGKTQVATEYAYRYHQDYLIVLWVRSENQNVLISSYTQLATLLKLPERDAGEQEVHLEIDHLMIYMALFFLLRMYTRPQASDFTLTKLKTHLMIMGTMGFLLHSFSNEWAQNPPKFM